MGSSCKAFGVVAGGIEDYAHTPLRLTSLVRILTGLLIFSCFACRKAPAPAETVAGIDVAFGGCDTGLVAPNAEDSGTTNTAGAATCVLASPPVLRIAAPEELTEVRIYVDGAPLDAGLDKGVGVVSLPAQATRLRVEGRVAGAL